MRIEDLYDPCLSEVMAFSHSSEKMPSPAIYAKANLAFPSGEKLPVCWLDPDYATRKCVNTSQAILIR